eukprot:GHVO01016198.1.p1 GENE.GHVO01016198.1~~GHVO01016198.1.p1  ORF type:complete len:303 (-),score=15.16 GHVO01016198.1:100-1008(-)
MWYYLLDIVQLIHGCIVRLPFVGRVFDLLTLTGLDLIRLMSGGSVAGNLDKCKRPAKPLVLYEFEFCPYCRKVRETLNILAIDYMVYPCPKETFSEQGVIINSRYRPVVQSKIGKAQFPFLIDPNENKEISDSSDIVKYLFETYGKNAILPLNYRIANSPTFLKYSMKLPVLFRPLMSHGTMRCPSRLPEKPLELWAMEGSPFARRVRECLSCAEIPYLVHTMPHGAKEKRAAFKKEHPDLSYWRRSLGAVKTPYLEDPNKGVKMFESRDIVEYIKNTYVTGDVAQGKWSEFGKLLAKSKKA